MGTGMRIVLLLPLVVAAWQAIAFAQEGADPVGAVLRTGSADYQVGPHDVLEVRVFKEDELSRTVQVTAAGMIALGLVGDVNVTGLTAAQIEDKLEQLYGADYLVTPQIFVTVKEYRSQVVQVLGAVKSPGVYRLTGPTKVLDVLSMTGGVSEQGGAHLMVLRAGDGARKDQGPQPEKFYETHDVDVNKLLAEGDTSQNIGVKGGDVVFVPRGDEVYVLGEVKNPGALKFEEGLTVTQAISKVAGFTRTASKRRVQVVRLEAGLKKQIDVNVSRIEDGKDKDVVLQARDLIVVPESIF